MEEEKETRFIGEKMKEAFRIAEIHLKKFEKFNKNITRRISNIYPIYEPFGKEPSVFEAILQDEKGRKEGYILISLSREFPPIIKFSFTGKSDYDHLREKVGSADFKPVIFTPFCMVAEDQEGNYITHYGDLETIPRDMKKHEKEFDYTNFKKCFMEQREKFFKKKEKDTLHKWNKILKKKIKRIGDLSQVDYIEPANVPSHNFQVVTAYYPEYLGRYEQIAPNTGANSAHNFWSGCTSCAWMCLIGYHDNNYTLDFMRGTHYTRGTTNSYPSQVMVALSEHLGTHKAKNSDGGSCDPGNIKKGYSFIEDVMGYSIVSKRYIEDDGIPALQVVYDALCFWGVPSVISIPGHSLIAYEVLADLNDDRGDHYMRVYEGYGDPAADDPYITYELIDDGAWTFRSINTNHEFNINHQSITTPVTIELGHPQYSTELVIGTRLPNENIGLLYSQNGRDFELRYEIAATGDTPPSLAVEDYRTDPYIAWKEADGTLRLAQVYPKGNYIIDLIAPPGVSSYHGVGPVIQVFERKLFYIWDNNITYTNVQNLERSGRPWPTEYGYHEHNDSYLSSLGIVIPESTPCFTTVNNKLYYAYTMYRPGVGGGAEMLIFNLTNEGEINYFHDNEGSMVYPGKVNLLYCEDILYGSSGGSIAELSTSTQQVTSETKYHPYDVPNNHSTIGKFTSYEIGPSVFSIYLEGNDIVIRYHSVDNSAHRLDYSGYPNF